MAKRPNPLDRFAREIRPGRLEWIGVRPGRRAPMQMLQRARAVSGRGLEGDHRVGKSPGSGRQVTLISRELIGQTAHFLGIDEISPDLLRRNLVVSGINLHALRHQRFRIGDVLFEASALCHPCSRMQEALGEGGVAAMLGHGGLCCRILSDGDMAVGDEVRVEAPGESRDLFE